MSYLKCYLHQYSSQHWNKCHLQPSILYCVIIGIIRLRLTRERIEDHLITITRTMILGRSTDHEASTSHTRWRSLQEEGPPHDSIKLLFLLLRKIILLTMRTELVTCSFIWMVLVLSQANNTKKQILRTSGQPYNKSDIIWQPEIYRVGCSA